MIKPKSVEALLFDFGGVIYGIDFERVLREWDLRMDSSQSLCQVHAGVFHQIAFSRCERCRLMNWAIPEGGAVLAWKDFRFVVFGSPCEVRDGTRRNRTAQNQVALLQMNQSTIEHTFAWQRGRQ